MKKHLVCCENRKLFFANSAAVMKWGCCFFLSLTAFLLLGSQPVIGQTIRPALENVVYPNSLLNKHEGEHSTIIITCAPAVDLASCTS